MGEERSNKVWCTEHHCHPMQCFFQHQIQTTPDPTEPPERVAVDMLVLPCRHLTDRPTKRVAEVECGCGRRWKLRYKDGEGWDARELPE